jgi:hypothetical protein
MPQDKVLGLIPGRALSKYSSDLFLLSACSRHGVLSASNRNEYQGIFLGG